MQIQVECPICEAILQFDKSALHNSVVCPECNRDFVVSTDILVPFEPPEDILIRQPPVLSDPTPSQIPAIKPDPAESVEYTLSRENTPRNKTSARKPTPNDVNLRKRKHVKGQSRPWLSMPVTLIALALIAIALLVFLPFALDFSNSLTANNEDSSTIDDVSKVNNVAEKGLNSNHPRQPKDSDAGPELDQPKPRKREPDTSSFTVYTEGQAANIWRDAKPRIVQLDIQKSTGSITAVGTIVDSRGWVVTSYRALVGAERIRVRQTERTYESGAKDELLTDSARGVLAINEKADLALISVNRRFVVTVSEIELALQDRVVAAKHLFQAIFPKDSTRKGVREVRVKNRRRLAELTPQQKAEFAKTNLTDANVDWIQLTDAESIPGAPLLDDKGIFVGITTHQNEGNHIYAVPVKHVRELMNESDGTIQEIASIQSVGIEDDPPLLPDNSAIGLNPMAPGAIAGASNARAPSANLRSAGAVCKQFDFQPNDIQQYRDLQDLARQMHGVQRQIVDTKEAARIAELKKQFESWKSALAPKTEILAKKFNQLALKGMQEDPSAFLAYAQVYYSAMVSPKFENKDTVTFKLLGTNRLIVCPMTDDMPAFRPASKWFLTLAGNDLIQLEIQDPGKIDNKPMRANFARILWINGELTD